MRDRFQVVSVDADGARSVATYPTEAEARAGMRRLQRRLPAETITVDEALDRYEKALKAQRRRPRTIAVYLSAIRQFLDPARALRDVTTGYLRERVGTRLESVAVDTAASELRATRTFLRWCVGDNIMLPLPAKLAEVRVKGRRSTGKPQLTIDEARAYLDAIVPAADAGDEGAIAASCPLLLGCRSREILDRQVRDLDEEGAVLWIVRGKTPRASRRLEVPEPLRGWLLELAAGKEREARLFGGKRPRANSWLADQVIRWCLAAKVPEVCPHGLRGTHGTLAEQAGATPALVAASLGHASERTALRHYTTPSGRATGRQKRALQVLRGGRGPDERFAGFRSSGRGAF